MPNYDFAALQDVKISQITWKRVARIGLCFLSAANFMCLFFVLHVLLQVFARELYQTS